jgi:hypothetical protein
MNDDLEDALDSAAWKAIKVINKGRFICRYCGKINTVGPYFDGCSECNKEKDGNE